MSYVAKTAFEARITNNEFNDLCNIAGKYQASSVDADCSAGLLCVRVSNTAVEGFSGLYNENSWVMNAAASTAVASDGIYACNPYTTHREGAYYIGSQTLGVGAPAGEYATFTEIDFDGKSVYRFGEGNVSGTVGDKTYFTVADGMLVPASAAPTDQDAPYFVLRGTGNFVEGNNASFKYYDVVAKKVAVYTPAT